MPGGPKMAASPPVFVVHLDPWETRKHNYSNPRYKGTPPAAMATDVSPFAGQGSMADFVQIVSRETGGSTAHSAHENLSKYLT